MAWIGFKKLAGALAALARPASEVYNGASKREADKAAAQTDGETAHRPPRRQEGPPSVARAASVGQIVELRAEPPLAWIAARAAFRCEAESTEVAVVLADGSRARHVYAQGTLIPVAGGLIHFPSSERASPEN